MGFSSESREIKLSSMLVFLHAAVMFKTSWIDFWRFY